MTGGILGVMVNLMRFVAPSGLTGAAVELLRIIVQIAAACLLDVSVSSALGAC